MKYTESQLAYAALLGMPGDEIALEFARLLQELNLGGPMKQAAVKRTLWSVSADALPEEVETVSSRPRVA